MKENDWAKIENVLSDDKSLTENAIPSEYFSICNILKGIENNDNIEECFYLAKIEASIISFCTRFKGNKKLELFINRIESTLSSNITLDLVSEYKRLFENMQRIYANMYSDTAITKILQ